MDQFEQKEIDFVKQNLSRIKKLINAPDDMKAFTDFMKKADYKLPELSAKMKGSVLKFAYLMEIKDFILNPGSKEPVKKEEPIQREPVLIIKKGRPEKTRVLEKPIPSPITETKAFIKKELPPPYEFSKPIF